MLLSVIVPVYNEEKTIEKLLQKVLDEKTNKEIIVVDDGSFDQTRSILNKIKNPKIKIFLNEKNIGKGGSVRFGISKAKGDFMIIQDADLEYDPNDYPRLYKPIVNGETEVVYGTRLKNLKFCLFGKEKIPMPIHYICNRLLSFLTNILYGSSLTDMETCYKMISKKIYKKLTLVSNGFEIEPEITAKILKNNWKILEIPIKTKPRNYLEGKKIKTKDAFIAIKTLIKYRFT